MDGETPRLSAEETQAAAEWMLDWTGRRQEGEKPPSNLDGFYAGFRAAQARLPAALLEVGSDLAPVRPSAILTPCSAQSSSSS